MSLNLLKYVIAKVSQEPAAISSLTTKHCFRKTKLKEILLWDYFVIIFLVMTEKDCPGTATFASLTRSDVEGVVAFFSLSKTKKLVKRKGENMNLDNGHLTDIISIHNM